MPLPSSIQAADDDALVREHRRKRLKNIIISRLKDTRDVLEIRDVLSRSWKTGGMEFNPEQADRIIKEVEQAKLALAEEFKVIQTEIEVGKQRLGGMAFEQAFERHMEELSEPELEAPPKEELLQEESKIRNPKFETQPAPPLSGATVQEYQKSRTQSQPQTELQTSNFKLQDSGKPRVDSVVTTPFLSSKPRVLGPIEELAGMTLEDFRRFGAATEAVRRIVEKVDLLAADSLLEQKKAIDAWKKSEVYKSYLSIGTESLEKKVSVIDVIGRRKSSGSATLTPEEFNAVGEVNRKISFSR